MTSATSGRTLVHTDWSSLLLMLLFIFLRSGIGNVGAMTERVPAPVHRKKKNQAKFPALDSSALVGLDSRGV